MGGSRIVVLCLALAAAVAAPGPSMAQSPPSVVTIMLPNNLARDGALANEAFRHDRMVAHIHDNMRRAEYAHQQRLENIQNNDRIGGAQKAKLVADENERFQNDMRALQRQLPIAEQEHAKREADIRARYPEPGDKFEFSDRFNVETAALDRARDIADEDARYDRAAAHVDENRRSRQVTHEERLKAIDEGRQPDEAKAVDREEENEIFEIDMRNLDRVRKVVDEEHENRRAAIDARYGGGGDVFASQSEPAQRPPLTGGAEQTDAGAQPPATGGGTPSPSRPPLTGATQQNRPSQTGPTQADRRTPPQSRPPLLKGRVEENVGFPPQPGDTAQQPCGKEWEFGTPDPEYQFVEGLSDSLARCAEADWAMMPVAGPLALASSKVRFMGAIANLLARAGGAAALYRDLQQQRPAGECAYDTALWYGQLICDTRALTTKMPEERPSERLDPIRPVSGPRPAPPPPRSANATPVRNAPDAPPAAPPGMPAPGPIQCVPLEDCFWRAMRNASGDPAFDPKYLSNRPTSWQEVYDTFKRYFAGKVPGVTSQAHANGIPERLTYDQMMQDLQSRDGAEAVVIAVYNNNESHAFNGVNIKGRVALIDDQKQTWDGSAPRQLVEQALRGQVAYWLYYRTK